MPINENSEYTSRFAMVFLPTQRTMLQELAADAGVKESALIRQWIEDAYAKRFPKRKPGAPAPKPNSLEARAAKAKRAKK